MAPKKTIFVDVEADSGEALERSAREPEQTPEPEPEPDVKPTKKPLSEDRLAKLAAARVKALAACKAKAERTKLERQLLKDEKAKAEANRSADVDALIAKKKEMPPDPPAPKPAPVSTTKDAMTPEMKQWLKLKARKYVTQALNAQPAPTPTPPPPPAGDVKMLAKGRVVKYLTEETLQQAMNSIFPTGRY